MTRTALRLVPLALLALSGAASAQNVSEQEAYEIAKEAYVYAYPGFPRGRTAMAGRRCAVRV
ncbi:MAG: hypothetical protein ACRECW_07735 [Phyllobacterium sp.]